MIMNRSTINNLFFYSRRKFYTQLNKIPVISALEYQERRVRLIELLLQKAKQSNVSSNFYTSTEYPIALILSKRKTFMAQDVPYVFRQCSNFRYLCGITIPESRLLISKNKSVLFVPEKDSHQIIWDGKPSSFNELQALSGVDQVMSNEEFEVYFSTILRDDVMVALDAEKIYEMAYQDVGLRNLSRILEGVKKIPLNTEIDKLRWTKSPTEQKLMRLTCRIGSEAINSMISGCRSFSNESHLIGFLEFEVRRRGAKFLAYPPVVAGGKNANTIHYIESTDKIDKRDCILVDAGCDLDGYCSDITRVFPASGQFSASQRLLYDALHHIQNQLLTYVKVIRPLKLNELYLYMLEQMGEVLSSINFFEQNNFDHNQLIQECDRLCPHHVSHYLGLDVHDVPSISRQVEVRDGVIITVEPGIYVRPENLAVREEFRGLGMRIEDVVLVRESGSEVLTESCLRNADSIEFAIKSC